MIRKALIELIKRNYYGGVPSDDHTLTDNEVNLYLNQGIALAAKSAYRDSIALDGIESLPDAFYSTFKITISDKDTDTGYWYLTLPQPPLGLSLGYSIAQLTFPGSTGLSGAPVPVSQRELQYFDELPTAPNKIYYWAEGTKLYMRSFVSLNGKKAIIRMASTSSSTLTDEVNIPDDQIPVVMEYVLKLLQTRKAKAPDIQNDGVDN